MCLQITRAAAIFFNMATFSDLEQLGEMRKIDVTSKSTYILITTNKRYIIQEHDNLLLSFLRLCNNTCNRVKK